MTTWYPGLTLENMEKDAILQALRFFGGNKTHTAKALGIAIRTLDNKLAKWETKDEPESEEQPKLERVPEGIHPARRLNVESATQASTKQSVPVREQSQVQKVLPKQNARSNSKATA